ncbi:MAG TPA: DUF4139 domain-containing protein [Chthoniobacteraceae bacterium]|jgi:hypothetical protein|nr:DUF4139 domain-containing protein [Chthoniobacteraceae bacterium]
MKFPFVAAWLAGVSPAFAADPALTVYNQNFAVVREVVPLDLQAGVTQVKFTGATERVEASSVILRDPAGKVPFSVLEQNYRNDPVSEGLLLSLNEGKTIGFLVHELNKPDRTVQGKIIRSGYQPGMQRLYQMGLPPLSQPIIEVEGLLRFSLPGQPLFPALGGDTILKPTLSWQIASERPAKLDAELSYITKGLSWLADYNIVAPEKGDLLDLVGWVTIENKSGKTFTNAHLKLIAGDVRKEQDEEELDADARIPGTAGAPLAAPAPNVTEKTFDEYHLYNLARPSTLHDRETKQVEFIRAAQVPSQRLYIYDGLRSSPQYRGYGAEQLREDPGYGTDSNPKVWVMREFKNSEANHLGMPLPAGRVRFYRQDGESVEFTGENKIDHTAKDETLRIYTGDAFDIVGERKRTNFQVDNANHMADESFEIKLRNHKREPVEVRVVEHLYRWVNWVIKKRSAPFTKTDSQAMEFRVTLKPDEERVVTYDVHYSW